MKNNLTCLVVHDGYTIDVKNHHLNLEAARRVLLSRKQHHYTCAVKKENAQVTLTEHVITCPICGYHQSATPRFFGERISKLSKQDIDRWIYGQKGLWDDDDFLQLNKLVIPKHFKCPNCGASTPLGRNQVGIRVERDNRGIKIRCRGMANGNLLSEILELNLHRGRAVLTQYRIWEQKQVVRDITEHIAVFRDSHIYQLLKENMRVRKVLHRYLRDAWEQGLPYRHDQMQPETFIILTRFLRYPVSFYDVIPWCDGGAYKINTHFSAIAKQMHDGKQLQAVVASLRPLSGFRAIRRLLLEQPGLVFYHQEAEKLLEIMGYDPAAFCGFLRSKHSFWLLSQMAAYPLMKAFLGDYCNVKGVAMLVHQLNRSAGMVRYYALEYGCMDKERQKEEQRHWKDGGMEFWPGPGFSVALPLGENCNDGRVGQYSFRYLRSTNELQECGRLVNNPLLGLQAEGTVVLVSQGTGNPLGVVQIYENVIVAVEGKNGPLFGGARRALETWAKTQGLHFDGEEESKEYCF